MTGRTALPIVGLPLADRERAAGHDVWGVSGGQVLAPHAVEIQPTAHCHRTCTFCSHIIRNRRGGQLSSEEVRGLLTELESIGVRQIAFSGGGEPLYWADGDITDMVRKAARFAEVSLTTSGDQLWNAEDGALHPDAGLLLEHCATMYFNIPAVDELSWAKQVRGPSGWPHTKAMITKLLALRNSDRGRYRCELHAVVVVSAFNIEQIERIDGTLTEIGVDAIYYKQWKNFERRKVNRLRLEDEHIVRRLDAIPPTQRSRDLSKFIALLKTSFPKHTPCWANRLAYNAIIDPNGDIYLCTPTVGNPEFSIGNLDDGGFSSCWRGALRTERLHELNDLSYQSVCPRECRHHPDNARVQAGLSD